MQPCVKHPRITRFKVSEMITQHPNWTAEQIAIELGGVPAHIREVARRMGLKLPPKQNVRRGHAADNSLVKLGHACRAAGITFDDIRKIAEQRKLRGGTNQHAP